jgi:AcrR family transcriptional regulator
MVPFVNPHFAMPVETEPTTTERPLRADARRNRERILEAAREVFAQAGAEAQIDDIAERAGVGVGTVYRHFPTKEALMGELIRQRFAVFTDHAREALDQEGEPFEVFAGLLRRNAAVMAQDAATRHALMSAGEGVWEYAGAQRDELQAAAAVLVDRAHRAGTLRADFGVDDIPMLMCGLSATMAHTGGAFDWRRHLDLLLDGLRTH